MLRKAFLIMVVAAVFGLCGYMLTHDKAEREVLAENFASMRIISLSPSLTEALFTLGLGDNVIGVTRYCDYPPTMHAKQIIGGYYDHNYEIIMHLQPDLVFALAEQTKSIEQFNKLGVPIRVFNMHDIDSILETLLQMGASTGHDARAAELVAAIRERIAYLQALTCGITSVPALLCVGRNMGGSSVRDVHAAGSGTYIGMLLQYVGGVNVYDGAVAYPSLTTEAVIRLNPAVILEMVPEVEKGVITAAEVMTQWDGLDHIDAVRNHQIHVLTGSYTTVPGARMILLMEDMLQILHPELGYQPDLAFAKLLQSGWK